MDKKFEKLNITINNFEKLDKVEEEEGCVKIFSNEIMQFEVYKNSTVYAWNSSAVNANGSSTVNAYGSSTVNAYGSSTVFANDSSTVSAYNSSTVYANDNSKVNAYNSSTVYANDNSKVNALNISTVEAYDKSVVIASDNTTIRAYHCSTVTADKFSVIILRTDKAQITKNDNWFGAEISQVFKVKKDTVVYKKLRNNLICELVLKKGQKFQSENFGKCRTNKAFVLKTYDMKTKEEVKVGHSLLSDEFKYEVNKVVEVKNYDKNIAECSNGIHFFLTLKEAEDYNG